MKDKLLVFIVVALFLGTLSGFGLSKTNFAKKLFKNGQNDELSATPKSLIAEDKSKIKPGDVFGSQNTESFKDKAEGYLEIGGHEAGEGTHKLLRPGGPSQNVYLTSSVTDLDQFDGMSVKVWGDTFKAQSAGWLMDVGRVEVVKIQGNKPFEAE